MKGGAFGTRKSKVGLGGRRETDEVGLGGRSSPRSRGPPATRAHKMLAPSAPRGASPSSPSPVPTCPWPFPPFPSPSPPSSPSSPPTRACSSAAGGRGAHPDGVGTAAHAAVVTAAAMLALPKSLSLTAALVSGRIVCNDWFLFLDMHCTTDAALSNGTAACSKPRAGPRAAAARPAAFSASGIFLLKSVFGKRCARGGSNSSGAVRSIRLCNDPTC